MRYGARHVSSKAFEKRGQVSKLEFADDSIFQIISKYVEISEKPYVLEMIYKDNDGVLLGAYGKTDFMDNIETGIGQQHRIRIG